MKKEAVLEVIKAKLDKQFGSLSEAARFFGVDRSNLSLAVNDHLKEIPDYLLEWAGYYKTTTTVYFRRVK